jgi:hypothetical protein
VGVAWPTGDATRKRLDQFDAEVGKALRENLGQSERAFDPPRSLGLMWCSVALAESKDDCGRPSIIEVGSQEVIKLREAFT